MLELAVVVIAVIMIVANFDIVLGLAVWAGMLAVGLAALAAMIVVFTVWPVQGFGTIILFIGVYFLIEWDNKREAKRQAKEHQTN